MFEFDSKLLKAPKTLKELVHHYKQKGQILNNKRENNNSKHSFFDNLIMDIFLPIATILSMIATAAIDHIVCRHAKLKALLKGTAFQPVKQTEAVFDNGKDQHNCTVQWYTIAALTVMITGLTIYVLATMQISTIFNRRLYSNTVTVMCHATNYQLHSQQLVAPPNRQCVKCLITVSRHQFSLQLLN